MSIKIFGILISQAAESSIMMVSSSEDNSKKTLPNGVFLNCNFAEAKVVVGACELIVMVREERPLKVSPFVWFGKLYVAGVTKLITLFNRIRGI